MIRALTFVHPEYQAVVVGETLDPIETDSLLKLVADKTFSQVQSPLVVIVPGGAAAAMRALGDDSLIAYVQRVSEKAAVVDSVCTGSLILAAAGLLEGRKTQRRTGVFPSSLSDWARTTSPNGVGSRTAGCFPPPESPQASIWRCISSASWSVKIPSGRSSSSSNTIHSRRSGV